MTVIMISIAEKNATPNTAMNKEPPLPKKKGNMKIKELPLPKVELASMNSPAIITAKPSTTSDCPLLIIISQLFCSVPYFSLASIHRLAGRADDGQRYKMGYF
jgi:hypothetical protein